MANTKNEVGGEEVEEVSGEADEATTAVVNAQDANNLAQKIKNLETDYYDNNDNVLSKYLSEISSLKKYFISSFWKDPSVSSTLYAYPKKGFKDYGSISATKLLKGTFSQPSYQINHSWDLGVIGESMMNNMQKSISLSLKNWYLQASKAWNNTLDILHFANNNNRLNGNIYSVTAESGSSYIRKFTGSSFSCSPLEFRTRLFQYNDFNLNELCKYLVKHYFSGVQQIREETWKATIDEEEGDKELTGNVVWTGSPLNYTPMKTFQSSANLKINGTFIIANPNGLIYNLILTGVNIIKSETEVKLASGLSPAYVDIMLSFDYVNRMTKSDMLKLLTPDKSFNG